MKNEHNLLITLGFAAVGSLLASPSFAATPKAYLENAQVFATGKKIQAFRVPTTDIDGKVKYYDLTIDLNILDDGKIDTVAASIKAALSPNFAANKFIAGTYVDGLGATCTVVTTVLQGGRTEAAMSCKHTNGHTIQANWVTGLIKGHPFELELKAAKIDLIPAYSNYSWGKVANSTTSFWWGCMGANEILSARQNGTTLSLGGYNSSNQQACGVNLTKK